MKDKILVHIDDDLQYFGVAKELKHQYNFDIFAIAQVDDNKQKYLSEQNLVKFNNIWFYPDQIPEKLEVDFEYLKKIEEKYQINIWKIVSTDRRFYQEFNAYYKFSYLEILSLVEKGCKFYDSILEDVQPDFLMMKAPFAYHDNLLYEMCKNTGIKLLCLRGSGLGFRWMISQHPNKMDSFSEEKSELKFANFEDLQDYVKRFDASKAVTKLTTIQYHTSKMQKLKLAIQFLFKNDEKIRRHYINSGRTKWKLITKGTARIFYLKRNLIESFMEKNFIKDFSESPPFAYLPLHVEPERSLHTDTPFYTDQLEIIRRIAKSLPIDFKLYVKDHPGMKNIGWRSKNYYKQIMELPNVELIHPSVKQTELYKKCKLVISINGSAILESNIYGKPSIIFSDADYSRIPSVFKVDKMENLPAIIKLALETRVEPLEVGKYLENLDKNSFEMDLWAITHDFFNRFTYHGYLEIPNYPTKEVNKFFDDHKDDFEKLAQEHIKKIQQQHHCQKNLK